MEIHSVHNFYIKIEPWILSNKLWNTLYIDCTSVRFYVSPDLDQIKVVKTDRGDYPRNFLEVMSEEVFPLRELEKTLLPMYDKVHVCSCIRNGKTTPDCVKDVKPELYLSQFVREMYLILKKYKEESARDQASTTATNNQKEKLLLSNYDSLDSSLTFTFGLSVGPWRDFIVFRDYKNEIEDLDQKINK